VLLCQEGEVRFFHWGFKVAEANQAAQGAGPAPSGSGGQKPTLFIILAILNMLFVVGVGALVYLGKKQEAAQPKIDDVIQGEAAAQKAEAEQKEFIGKLIPLETFLVNLAGSRGRKLAKVNLELEVNSLDVQEEIEKLKPKIRDIIIIILSSKSYAQVSAKEGKDALRDEIRDQVNLFLTKGQIKRVYFTEFIYN
jgi:flagellar FliL protein